VTEISSKKLVNSQKTKIKKINLLDFAEIFSIMASTIVNLFTIVEAMIDLPTEYLWKYKLVKVINCN